VLVVGHRSVCFIVSALHPNRELAEISHHPLQIRPGAPSPTPATDDLAETNHRSRVEAELSAYSQDSVAQAADVNLLR